MQCRRLHFDAVDVIDSGRNFPPIWTFSARTTPPNGFKRCSSFPSQLCKPFLFWRVCDSCQRPERCEGDFKEDEGENERRVLSFPATLTGGSRGDSLYTVDLPSTIR